MDETIQTQNSSQPLILNATTPNNQTDLLPKEDKTINSQITKENVSLPENKTNLLQLPPTIEQDLEILGEEERNHTNQSNLAIKYSIKAF